MCGVYYLYIACNGAHSGLFNEFAISLQLGTDHLTCRVAGGGYGFLYRSEICFRTIREL
jgi:hypothetical protein